jgi:hypothetical protein
MEIEPARSNTKIDCLVPLCELIRRIVHAKERVHEQDRALELLGRVALEPLLY